MHTSPLLSATAFLVLSSAGIAQDRPPITLTAGDYEVGALVERLGSLMGTTIAADASTFGGELQQRVALQTTLELDVETAADLVSELLYDRGVLIGGEGDELRAFPVTGQSSLRPPAVEREATAILARPHRIELVQTLADGGDNANLLNNMLRPFLAAAAHGPGFTMRPERGQLLLAGPTDRVVLGLQLLALIGGAPAPAPRPTAWQSARPLPWPGGKVSGEQFVELFCETLGANVIGTPQAIGQVDLGEPAALPAPDWFVRATEVAFAGGLMLAPVLPEHRVFAVGRAGGPIQNRAAYEAPAIVRSERAVVPVVTVYELKKVNAIAAINKLRPHLAGKKVTLGMLGTPSRLLLCGPRHQVREALERVTELEGE